MENQNLTNSVADQPIITPVQNVLEKRSFFSSELFLIIFAFVLICVSSGTTYYLMGSKKENIPSMTKPTSIPTQTTRPTEEAIQPTIAQDTPIDRKTSIQTFGSFKYPSDWVIMDKYPNGITYKSPDFNSEINLKSISSGTALTVSESNKVHSTLEEAASSASNGAAKDIRIIEVDGQRAIVFIYSGMENGNTNIVSIVDKGETRITFVLHLKINTPIPYPNLMDDITSTFKFK
jgi:hypothetical protein